MAAVSPVSFKDPKQLDGKRVGYHAPITVTEALVKWMAQHYKITPNWLIIPARMCAPKRLCAANWTPPRRRSSMC